MPPPPTGLSQPVAVIDPHRQTRVTAATWLREAGYHVLEFASLSPALWVRPPAVVCLGVSRNDGTLPLRQLRSQRPEMPVVLVANSPDSASAMLGSTENEGTLVCSFERSCFLQMANAAAAQSRLLKRIRTLEEALRPEFAWPHGGWASDAMRASQVLLERAAEQGAPVVLIGEPGVGKTSAARFLHASKGRESGRFVVATSAQDARVQTAKVGPNSTLCVTNFGSIPQQERDELLERTAEASVQLVGIRSDAEDPDRSGTLQSIDIAPLRERRVDLPWLLSYWLARSAAQLGRLDEPRLTPDAARILEDYEWPGNQHEMQVVLQRALLSSERSISPGHLPAPFAKTVAVPGEMPLITLRELEAKAIRRALDASGGNVSEAARLLGIGRATLYRRLHQVGNREEE